MRCPSIAGNGAPRRSIIIHSALSRAPFAPLLFNGNRVNSIKNELDRSFVTPISDRSYPYPVKNRWHNCAPFSLVSCPSSLIIVRVTYHFPSNFLFAPRPWISASRRSCIASKRLTGSILDDTLYHIRIECLLVPRRKIIRSLNKRKIFYYARIHAFFARCFFISSLVLFSFRETLE